MKRIAPSERKKQALEDLIDGRAAWGPQGVLSEFIRRSVEIALQEVLEREQEETIGRARYERGSSEGIYRNGYEVGRVKTGEGVMEVEKPQIRGLGKPYRSGLWEQFHATSEQLRQLLQDMYVRG
jgi:transposase-like protein